MNQKNISNCGIYGLDEAASRQSGVTHYNDMMNSDFKQQYQKGQKPRYDVADIFNRYWLQYTLYHKVHTFQQKVISAIQNCRTAILVGHIEFCSNNDCDYESNAYNSCRNRHCSKCQYSKQIEWVHNRLKELLPIPYFHQVFTLPHILNPLCLYNKEIIYDLFFKSCSYTLNAFAKDPKFLGAKIGFIGILHTWGQKLEYHIHIHFIVSGGGLLFDKSRFIRLPYQNKFLFPSNAMSCTLRGKFVNLLKKAYQEGKLIFPDELACLKNPDDFQRFCNEVGRQAWYNYTKKPFSGPDKVVQYISRYTHRVAITNHRLLDIDNDTVTFSYQDYKDRDKNDIPKTKEMTLTSDHFIQRFLWHVLPSGFKKIRYFGFLSSGLRKESLELARSLLDYMNETSIQAMQGIKDWLDQFGDFIERKCPKCGIGTLIYRVVPVYDTS